MLSDYRILKERLNGNIVIEPFDPKQLGTNSYGCTLGPYYYVANEDMQEMYVDNQEDVSSFWRGPMRAPQTYYIPVRPGGTILAHTQEIVGGKNGFLANMHSKSTIARLGLSVCRCAGVGDVGYINIWTMEISNHSKSVIWLPVGLRICQFVFEEVGQTLQEYHGHYGQGVWKPEDMLPKAAGIRRS